MKRHWKRLVGVTVVALLAQDCARMEASSSDDNQDLVDVVAPVTADNLVRVVNVETVTVTPTDFVDFIRIIGEVEALHDVLVSAEEGGVIGRFRVAKGTRVRRGQVLVEIDATVLSAQADEARASSSLASEQFERQRRLWEDEGIGSEINFLTARYQADMARARLATLEARLDKATIRAPVTGVFDDQYVDPGEIVMPGSPVARVVAIDEIKVVGGVPERYAPFVLPGRDAVVTFDIMPDRQFAGTISFVGSSVDDQSRTFLIEIVLANPGLVVKPQMVANVQLVREQLTDVIVVSQDYVVRSEAGYHVFVVDDGEAVPAARRRAVSLGAAFAGRVVILSGLDEGERIVGVGAQLVDDGSRLAVVESRGDGAGR